MFYHNYFKKIILLKNLQFNHVTKTIIEIWINFLTPTLVPNRQRPVTVAEAVQHSRPTQGICDRSARWEYCS